MKGRKIKWQYLDIVIVMLKLPFSLKITLVISVVTTSGEATGTCKTRSSIFKRNYDNLNPYIVTTDVPRDQVRNILYMGRRGLLSFFFFFFFFFFLGGGGEGLGGVGRGWEGKNLSVGIANLLACMSNVPRLTPQDYLPGGKPRSVILPDIVFKR